MVLAHQPDRVGERGVGRQAEGRARKEQPERLPDGLLIEHARGARGFVEAAQLLIDELGFHGSPPAWSAAGTAEHGARHPVNAVRHRPEVSPTGAVGLRSVAAPRQQCTGTSRDTGNRVADDGPRGMCLAFPSPHGSGSSLRRGEHDVDTSDRGAGRSRHRGPARAARAGRTGRDHVHDQPCRLRPDVPAGRQPVPPVHERGTARRRADVARMPRQATPRWSCA